MRVRSAALLVFLVCLLPIAAQADISRISPQSIPYGTAEENVTIFGTDLSGTESTLIVWDGPDGHYEFAPINPVENDNPEAPPTYPSNMLIGFIPGAIPYTPGTYQITVVAKDFNVLARVLGPVTFTVGPAPVDVPPIMSYNETVFQEATSTEGAVVNFDVTAQNPNGDPVAVSCSPASGTVFPIGTRLVTCSATNSFGTSTAVITVIVADTTVPIVTVPGNITTTNSVVTFTATATDNIEGALPVTCSPASGSTFGPGVTQVVCTATDSSNNIGVGVFNVIRPGGLPVLTVPADITVVSPDDNPVTVSYTVTATNDATVECLPSGNTFAVGTTTVTCTATNFTGSDTKSFHIIVTSGATPEITVPADITAQATSAAGATVTFVVTATNGATIVCTPASGSTFALGQTTVSCTATNAGGSDTGTFHVTVIDSIPPQILTVTANPGTLWPPNHKMVNVTVTVSAVDTVDPTPVSQIISVTSNQPINGTGDGDTSPDWLITGPLTVQLRSERSQGQDRTYTITVKTVDDAGNFSTATETVVVSNSKHRAVR
jgi:hypothetical protein